jgi:type VI secretion system protein ImpG
MRDDLLLYYERELSYLRRLGAEFAKKHPKVASRLLLEEHKCEDPHVERLLEGFAFLAARVHLKVDDDLSEVSEALLSVIYPHYVRPIPSMSLVEFRLDPEQGKLTSGLHIPRDSLLYSDPVDGVPCRFRTCYDTTVWPLTVADAAWRTPDQLDPPVRASDAIAALRFELRCLPDITLDSLELDTLRFHLHGEGNIVSTLYEVLCNNCMQILVRDPDNPKRPPITFAGSALQPAGFEGDEGMLPFARRSFMGYRLIQEYFAFPEKFMFLDLAVFDKARAAGFGEAAEIIFLISPFERSERLQSLQSGVSKDIVRLGCTPTVNLFPKTSEPIAITQRTHEYPVVADARRRQSTGIFSVDEVTGRTPGKAEPPRFEPLYSFRHSGDGASKQTFWYARRQRSAWRTEEGSDLFLSFADLSGHFVRPSVDAVTAKLTCYNGDLPSRLPFGREDGDFELDGGGPLEKIITLVKPTPVIEPPLGKPQLWRLISQLSLNYLSLVEGGAENLQELLRLHDFGESAVAQKQIRGIVDVSSGPCYSRIESEHGLTFARGHRVEIDFDEEHFTGGGVYLFASVLERFLGLFASLNSFCVLAARTRQRKEVLREWAPRAGSKALL